MRVKAREPETRTPTGNSFNAEVAWTAYSGPQGVSTMSGNKPECVDDAESAAVALRDTAQSASQAKSQVMSRATSRDSGLHKTDAGVSEVVVLDDTDPSLTELGYLTERNRQANETMRLLQDAIVEWVDVSDPVTA
jgi:hypothetical protein